MRSSSATPSSNSWLPTLETSRPIAFSDSTAGSSWNSPDRNGDAADQVAGGDRQGVPSPWRAGWSASRRGTRRHRPACRSGRASRRAWRRCRPAAARWPWKSLNDSTWSWTSFGFGGRRCASAVALRPTDPRANVRAMVTAAKRRRKRIENSPERALGGPVTVTRHPGVRRRVRGGNRSASSRSASRVDRGNGRSRLPDDSGRRSEWRCESLAPRCHDRLDRADRRAGRCLYDGVVR